MALNRAELLKLFEKTASEVVEREFSNLQEETSISELSIDSLNLMEIIASLERELQIRIPDESLSGIETIRDFLQVLEERQAAAGT